MPIRETPSRPPLDDAKFRRFRELLDENVESSVEVISSTKQRLERLDEPYDDDVIVVSTKPRNKLSSQNELREPKLFSREATIALTLMAFIALVSYRLHSYRRLFQNKKKQRATTVKASLLRQGRKIETSPAESSPKGTKPIPGGDHITSKPASTAVDSKEDATTGRASDELSLSEESFTPSLSYENQKSTEKPLMNVTIVHTETTSVSIQPGRNRQMSPASMVRLQKIEVASQLAQDIKLVQGILKEQGLDTSLAPQVAVSLQSSQHMISSQQHLESQRIMAEAHQKALDRQLSQQQHEESLAASRYDPSWREKLRERRDKCWNITSRFIWDVVAGHIAVKLAKPLMTAYKGNGGLRSSAHLAHLVVTNLCSCGDQHALPDPQSSSLFSVVRVSSFDALWYWLGWDSWIFEKGICYGYCIVSFASVSLLAVFMHQVLRAFSVPSLLHHVINSLVLWLLFSPQDPIDEILDLFWARPSFLILAASLVSLFGIVHWKYQRSHTLVARCKMTNFESTFGRCLDELDSLRLQICFVRYAAVAVYFSTFLYPGTTSYW